MTPEPTAGGVDVLKGVPLDLFFDLIAIRLNGPKADGKTMALNFVFPDTGEKIRTFVGNGVLNYVMGETDEKAAATSGPKSFPIPPWLN